MYLVSGLPDIAALLPWLGEEHSTSESARGPEPGPNTTTSLRTPAPGTLTLKAHYPGSSWTAWDGGVNWLALKKQAVCLCCTLLLLAADIDRQREGVEREGARLCFGFCVWRTGEGAGIASVWFGRLFLYTPSLLRGEWKTKQNTAAQFKSGDTRGSEQLVSERLQRVLHVCCCPGATPAESELVLSISQLVSERFHRVVHVCCCPGATPTESELLLSVSQLVSKRLHRVLHAVEQH